MSETNALTTIMQSLREQLNELGAVSFVSHIEMDEENVTDEAIPVTARIHTPVDADGVRMHEYNHFLDSYRIEESQVRIRTSESDEVETVSIYDLTYKITSTDDELLKTSLELES